MKLFIGIPAYQPVYPQFFMSILEMVRSVTGFQLGIAVGDSLVGRARNHLVSDFLESPCDTMLQIDSDILFTPKHIELITSHDEGIVGGFYPRKSDGPMAWIANGFDDGTNPPDERGLVNLMYMGTGFLCVKREVFEKMKEHWPDDNYVADGQTKRKEHNFFPVGVVPNRCDEGKTNRYLSEDWYFCERALQLRYKVWGDSRVILQHIGAAVYPLAGNQRTNPGLSERIPVQAVIDVIKSIMGDKISPEQLKAMETKFTEIKQNDPKKCDIIPNN